LSPDNTADANNNVVDLGVKSLQPEAQLIDVDALVCDMALCSDEEYAQPISDGELEICQPVAEDTRSVRVERRADVETGTFRAVRQSKLPPASVLREYISRIVKSSSEARKGVNYVFSEVQREFKHDFYGRKESIERFWKSAIENLSPADKLERKSLIPPPLAERHVDRGSSAVCGNSRSEAPAPSSRPTGTSHRAGSERGHGVAESPSYRKEHPTKESHHKAAAEDRRQ